MEFCDGQPSSLLSMRVTNMWYKPIMVALLVMTADFYVFAAGTTRSRRKNGNPQSRSVRVMNQAGVPIDIFWIHPETNELAPSHTSGEGVRFGGETGIASYIGHTFEVQELPSSKTKKCQGKLCRKAYFTVNTNEDQWVTINKEFVALLEDSKSRASKKAKESLSGCLGITDVDKLTACLTEHVEVAFNKEKEDIAFQVTVRKSMASLLSNYSCGSMSSDSSSTSPILSRPIKVSTTPSLRNDTYADEPLRTLFESDYSNVRLFENFLSEDDCIHVMNGGTVTSEIQAKIKDMLEFTGVLSLTESPALSPDKFHVKIESGPIQKAEPSEECDIQSDGSCFSASRSSMDTVVETTTTLESVAARLILTCVNTTRDLEEANLPTNSTDNSDASYSPSGMLLFVKAGVRVVPTDRSAVLIQYNEIASDQSILREPDPFLDEHVICPVTDINTTVAFISYDITHSN